MSSHISCYFSNMIPRPIITLIVIENSTSSASTFYTVMSSGNGMSSIGRGGRICFQQIMFCSSLAQPQKSKRFSRNRYGHSHYFDPTKKTEVAQRTCSECRLGFQTGSGGWNLQSALGCLSVWDLGPQMPVSRRAQQNSYTITVRSDHDHRVQCSSKLWSLQFIWTRSKPTP